MKFYRIDFLFHTRSNVEGDITADMICRYFFFLKSEAVKIKFSVCMLRNRWNVVVNVSTMAGLLAIPASFDNLSDTQYNGNNGYEPISLRWLTGSNFVSSIEILFQYSLLTIFDGGKYVTVQARLMCQRTPD